MPITINPLYGEAVWHRLGDAPDDPQIQVRPYPASRQKFTVRGGEVELTGLQGWDRFCYCLVAWQHVQDEAGKELPCDEATKRIVYDYGLGGLPDHVTRILGEMEEQRAGAEKNS